MTATDESVIARGRGVLDTEIAALAATRDALGEGFVAVFRAQHAAVRAGRKLLFTGVGKSAVVAQKLAATFNSVGGPACFLDATHALHGDLGLCAPGDVACILSNSGATQEAVRLVPLLRRFDVLTVAFTVHADSPLARACDLVLTYRVPREACPLDLAPTASTTAAMALGDALAMVLMEALGTTREDFARRHPSGALGASLLLRVRDIMRTGERFPRLHEGATVREALLAMTRAKAGSLVLVGTDGRLAGIFTDGDFRRASLAMPDVLSEPVARFMTPRPVTVEADQLAVEALRIFEQRNIDDLVAIDAAGRAVGLVDSQDLPRLRGLERGVVPGT